MTTSTSITGTSNITSGFIDLATFGEIDRYMYGGPNSFTYFVRETHKATWFTTVPVVLSRGSGNPGFNQEWSVSISRAGDYLVHTWLRVIIPSVVLLATNTFGADGRIRWTKNFMHNLIREACISFNDLAVARFDNYHLDFWSAFTVPASKRVGYNNMIGNVPSLIGPHGKDTATVEQSLLLPLPFFFSRDSGVALPTAAIPFNEMKITFHFRNWTELLILDNSASPLNKNNTMVPCVGKDISTAPELSGVQVWAEYAIVDNEERDHMGDTPRNILIEQVQTAPRQTFAPLTHPSPSYDIRFSHPIKALFFGVRNCTHPNVWSNYCTTSPVCGPNAVIYNNDTSFDPILHTSLIYESTNRISQIGSDYFSLITPWYHAPSIPLETGYHLYSYSLDFFDVDPMGSTNFGKLANVSISPTASPSAIMSAEGKGVLKSGADIPQKYEFIVTAVNNNIIRISGGAVGFPVM